MTQSTTPDAVGGVFEPLPGLQVLGADDAGVCIDGVCVIPEPVVRPER